MNKTQSPIINFNFPGFPEWMTQQLKTNGITKPTEIQAATIPFIMDGKDVLATATTGSGKTIAYLAPIIISLSESKQKTLIIVPTRELAKQIEHEAKILLGKKSPLQAIALIGGAPFHLQTRILKRSPNIIIGTPGRIIDHLQRNNLRLDQVTHLVLDETDRLLDQGFMPQVDEIRTYIDHHPQTVLLSATLPKQKLTEIKSILRSPEEVHIGKVNQPKKNIKVSNKSLKGKDKFNMLRSLINEDPKINVVFVNTKRHVETISEKLNMDDIPNCMLHGDIPHRKREKIIKQFREGLAPTLVATDVAARGIDIVHIERVINYDLPQAPEDYIHRIGRSARGEAKGEAVNFITEEDKIKWQNIENFIAGKKTIPESRSRYKGRRQDNFWSKSSKPGFKKSDGSDRKRPWSKDKPSFNRSEGSDKKRPWSKDKPSFDRSEGSDRKRPWSKDKPSFNRSEGSDKKRPWS
ncbi:MAG: DEAD/DEAH box helicase, partial [Gammaproteobacteria bacterium]|nr:DEAD/DEAH box helicase [Gammaproteobacteria bacterium]